MGKISNCPLCKASITMIKKVEHAATTDQKVYSQSIPCDYTSSDIFIPMEQEFPHNNLEVYLSILNYILITRISILVRAQAFALGMTIFCDKSLKCLALLSI